MTNKKLVLVLGNGFTIDFLSHLQSNGCDHGLDVANLFRDGASVPWPTTDDPGFLSFKHCPNLWNLGVRPNMSRESAMDLIENIITCVNVYASNPNKNRTSSRGKPNEIYINAYKELASYLKRLFVFYDQKIIELPDSIDNWSWYEYLVRAYQSEKYDEIHIITYNYDVWLERILQKADIPFNIAGLVAENSKITIYKPHGSISFKHRKVIDMSAYGIKYDGELLDGALEEFTVGYEGLGENFLVNAMIPPAGEASRFNHSWAGELQTKIKELTSSLDEKDDCIICGISYWHVDRNELDEIMVNSHPGMNIKLINPYPSRSLTAVITSIFDNFVLYPNSQILDGLLK